MEAVGSAADAACGTNAWGVGAAPAATKTPSIVVGPRALWLLASQMPKGDSSFFSGGDDGLWATLRHDVKSSATLSPCLEWPYRCNSRLPVQVVMYSV